jgi:two-component system response regulator FlrC
VRELDNVVQRALILSQGEEITAEDLLFEPATIDAVAAIDGEEDPADSLGDDLKDHERRLILVALEEGHGSRKYAAEKLGISPRTLRYKVAQMRDQGIAIPGR